MGFPEITAGGDTLPDELEVRILVEVIEAFSEQSPARLNIRVINEASHELRFYLDYVTPFAPMSNKRPEERTLCIVPDDTTDERVSEMYADLIPASPSGDCWRLKDEYLVPLSQRVVTTPSGGEVSNTYSVLNVPQTRACLPPGRYRFETEWGVGGPETQTERRHSWEFWLELSE